MRIALIKPYDRRLEYKGKPCINQLTLQLIAGLTPSRHQVEIYDANKDKIPYDEDFDLVGITIMTPTAPNAYEIADGFRAKNIPVIAGGIHVQWECEEALNHVDSVLIGEAEGIWKKIIQDAKNGKLKRIYENMTPALNGHPLPRRDLVDLKGYFFPFGNIETSRGCPFDCHFCSTTAFQGNRIRTKSVDEVIKDVEEVIKIHGRGKIIFFTDNNFIRNPGILEILEKLIPLKIKWGCQGDLGFAKRPKLLKLARESGCKFILIGFESLEPKAIEDLGNKRKVNVIAEYLKSVRRIQRNRIGIIGCFVSGFDGEDKSIFKQTKKFIKKAGIEIVQLGILTPYPGTKIRMKFLEQGRIPEKYTNAWDKYDILHCVFDPSDMTREELIEGYNWMGSYFYSRWVIAYRMLGLFLRPYNWLHPLETFFRMIGHWKTNLVYRKLFWHGKRDNFQ